MGAESDGDERAGDGGGFGVAGGVKGARVDALHGPDGESDGEDDEELGGGGGVGAAELAAAEKVHQPGAEGDHPGGDDHADSEEAGDGTGDGGGEVVRAILLEERSEEGQRGGAGGGADDVEGRVEEDLGVADEGDASLADRSEVIEEVAIEHDQRDADHEGERELEPLQKSGVAEAEDGAVMQAGAERAEANSAGRSRGCIPASTP